MSAANAPRVAILSTAHPAGDGRIRRWVEGFHAAGAHVTVVALGPAGQDSPFADDVVLEALPAATRGQRILRAVMLPFAQAFPSAERADLIVAIDPELYVPVLALKRAGRSRVIADIHEDFATVASDHDRWGPRLSRMLVGNGARLAVSAAAQFDATVVADVHLPPLKAKRRVVGRNVAEASDFAPPVIDPVGSNTQLRAVYAGDLTPQRGLVAMLEGAVASPAWQLDLFGPDRSWAQSLIADAVRRSDGRIQYRGLVPHAELVAELSYYDVGLSLLHPIPSYAAAMPSKIYEYQAAGLATITSDLPRCRNEIYKNNSGIVVSSTDLDAWPALLTRALGHYANDRQMLAAQRRNARRAAIAGGDQPDGLAAAVQSLTDLLTR